MKKKVQDVYGEILRLRNEFYQKWQEVPQYDENRDAYKAKYEAFDKALELLTPSFVDSQPEEPVNEELEKVAYEYSLYPVAPSKFVLAEQGFKDGANWQKQQMMKDAVIMEAHEEYGELWGNIRKCNTEKGKKYKVIIIKEE